MEHGLDLFSLGSLLGAFSVGTGSCKVPGSLAHTPRMLEGLGLTSKNTP